MSVAKLLAVKIAEGKLSFLQNRPQARSSEARLNRVVNFSCSAQNPAACI